MKSFGITLVVLSAVAFANAASTRNVFSGEISDSQCAMNVHSLSRSHQEMIKRKTLGTDAASCARACVRRGGEWVLRSGEVVYRLQNQDGVDEFAGQQVKVTGSLDSATNTIDNQRIELTVGKPAKLTN
jgi:hypothetical protein